MAHALSDRERVVESIKRETESAVTFETDYAEPCGWRGNFVRINLKAVAKGKITAQALADAFIASAIDVTEADLEAWKGEWQDIERAVITLYPTLAGLEADSKAIAQLLSEGKYAMHHSRQYNAAYAPHYRIVSRKEYEKLKTILK